MLKQNSAILILVILTLLFIGHNVKPGKGHKRAVIECGGVIHTKRCNK